MIFANTIFEGLPIPQSDFSSGTFQNVIAFIFAIVGIITVLMVLIAAFKMISSSGDSQKIVSARNTLLYSLVGLVVSLSAFTIVYFVLDMGQESETIADGDTVIVSSLEEEELLEGVKLNKSAAGGLTSISETRQEVESKEQPPNRSVFYLSPDGSTTGDGSSESPVSSLQQINDMLEKNPPNEDVRIIIAPGEYFGENIRWTYYSPEHFVRFEAEDIKNRPVFNGCSQSGSCNGGTFFSFTATEGENTNLDFWYLRIENYQSAINLQGRRGEYDHSRNNPNPEYNSGNRIYGVWFENIGNVYNPSIAPSTAVIRLVNSRDNLIQNNHFVNIINVSRPNLIHAVYASHHSSNNAIRNNRFLDNSGDPVRLRDHSNFNSITGNRFLSTGIEAAYSEWYCDHTVRSDCTKIRDGAGFECPSWGNEFRNNSIGSSYDGSNNLGVFRYFQSESPPYDCSPPAGETRRLYTSGNEGI